MTETLALVGGVIEPMGSPRIEHGTVLIRDGRILSVGTDAPPADAEVVDVAGRWVLPGLVDAHSHIGVHEDSVGPPGADVNESSLPNAAGIRALDAINPADPAFSDALAGGVTTVVVKPGSGNPIGGQSVAIKTAGAPCVDELVVREPLSVKSAFGENPKDTHGSGGRTPVTRMGTAFAIRQAFRDAENYRRLRDEGGTGVDLHNEALLSLLAGDLPWDVHAHRSDDIATAIRLAREFGLRLIVNHGTESHAIAGILADLGIPVVVGPLSIARSKVELAGHRVDTPKVLHQAGVEIALVTDHPEVPTDLLVLQAALAEREGLPRAAALSAITATPAAIYGLADRVGSLKPGCDADLVVWTGDPLDLRSRAERVFIGGAQVYERTPGSSSADVARGSRGI
jgi:imidazolonepropionase-like amidohydrolase